MLKNNLFIHLCWGILILIIIFFDKYNKIKIEKKSKLDHVPIITHSSDGNTNKIANDTGAYELSTTDIDKSSLPQKSLTPFKETDDDAALHYDAARIADDTVSKTTEFNEMSLPQKSLTNFKEIIGDSELHYIGVYESNTREYSTEEARARYRECEKKYNNNNYKKENDCWDYAYRAQKPDLENTITVNINSNKKISLILTSYDSVKWIIKGNTQNLKLVYISGYEASQISKFIHQPTKVYSNFYKGGACSYCLSSNLPYFYSYQLDGKLQKTINQYFKKPLTSFQGVYQANSFYIN